MNERAYAVIDLERLTENYKLLKERAKCPIICTVKANAYGHGAVPCVRALSDAGADFFCVATGEEALELRRVTDAQILVLGYTVSDFVSAAVENDIMLTVFSKKQAEILSGKVPAGRRLKVHLAINTGMNRIGLPCEFGADTEKILKTAEFDVCGIYTHLMGADEEEDVFSGRQKTYFDSFSLHVSPQIMRHIANSAGIEKYGNMGYDRARAGISLYGFSCTGLPVMPVMQLYARVVWKNRLKRGERVGYGGDFTARNDTETVTLSIGYADGFFRSYTGGRVLFKNGTGRVIGRVCMDTCIVEIERGVVSEGEYACIFDASGENTLSLCRQAGTICYEQLSAIGERIKRIYRGSGGT